MMVLGAEEVAGVRFEASVQWQNHHLRLVCFLTSEDQTWIWG